MEISGELRSFKKANFKIIKTKLNGAFYAQDGSENSLRDGQTFSNDQIRIDEYRIVFSIDD